MSRRLLQAVTATVGILTILLAGLQFALGADSPVYAAIDLPESTVLDSNLRFFAGLGLGLGFGLLWIVPALERRTIAFRAGHASLAASHREREGFTMIAGTPET